jgi:hypothetical protein
MRSRDRAASGTARGGLPRWRWSRGWVGWRARHSRGQALVEFALVAPILFLLIFGIIEFSLVNAAIGSYNFAAKDAARLGSLLGRTDTNADAQMIALIRSHVVGIAPAQLQEIDIFRSDEQGDPSTGIQDAYDASGNPIGVPTWPPSMRNDTLIDADYLGVRIVYRYTYLTGFISGGSSNLTLDAVSIQRIEPQDFQGKIEAAPHIVLHAPERPVAPDALVGLPAEIWKGGAA